MRSIICVTQFAATSIQLKWLMQYRLNWKEILHFHMWKRWKAKRKWWSFPPLACRSLTHFLTWGPSARFLRMNICICRFRHITQPEHTVVLMNFNYIKWIYVKVEKEENTGSHCHHHVQHSNRNLHMFCLHWVDCRSPILQSDLTVPHWAPSQKVDPKWLYDVNELRVCFNCFLSEQDEKR